MTYQNGYKLTNEMIVKGMEAAPELMRVLLNNAMQIEQSKYLHADQYERTEDRKGHANGYKPKTLRTRIGGITFAVPQVREGGFYPSALEKGMRSERALMSALASAGVPVDDDYVIKTLIRVLAVPGSASSAKTAANVLVKTGKKALPFVQKAMEDPHSVWSVDNDPSQELYYASFPEETIDPVELCKAIIREIG